MIVNTEFYNTPDGDVVVKPVNSPAYILSSKDREIISTMLTLINDRYPEAARKLMELYNKSRFNREYFEYRIVHRFIRCNFGEYDQLSIDIDSRGVMRMEEVRCPLRGECACEHIICRPKLSTSLSERELEVMECLVGEHLNYEQAAQRLYISPCTVLRHSENIKAKLGLHTLSELTEWYINNKKQGL